MRLRQRREWLGVYTEGLSERAAVNDAAGGRGQLGADFDRERRRRWPSSSTKGAELGPGDHHQLSADIDRSAAGDGPTSSTRWPSGWRRALVGERILAWLRGDLAVIGDPELASRIRMVPRTR